MNYLSKTIGNLDESQTKLLDEAIIKASLFREPEVQDALLKVLAFGKPWSIVQQAREIAKARIDKEKEGA